MSSILNFVNWTPTRVTPTLNGGVLQKVLAAEAKDSYVPYSISIERNATQRQPIEDEWCANNELLIVREGVSGTQIYRLDDPSPGQADTELFLWVFPDFIVFSQRSQQVGNRQYPQ